MDVYISLGSYNRKTVQEAMFLAMNKKPDGSLFSDIKCNKAQICPQNIGLIDEQSIYEIVNGFRSCEFRLHANVHVLPRRQIKDLSSFDTKNEYWQQLKRINSHLSAGIYSAHAGLRSESSINGLIDNVKKAQDYFECVVAVEGMYPAKNNPFLVSSWNEYSIILDSGIPFALDLSHINIVKHESRKYERQLVREMLSSENCLEIHISDNDGRKDSHRPFSSEPIWIDDIHYKNPKAVVFSESLN